MLAVAYCGELAGLARADALARAHDVLAFVGLHDARYRRPESFSTGMTQRLKVAQALVHDPDLLLRDEPTNGLDPTRRERMLGLIDELGQRRGISVILSSHLLPDAERTCQAFVALHQGTLAASGQIEQWRHRGLSGCMTSASRETGPPSSPRPRTRARMSG